MARLQCTCLLIGVLFFQCTPEKMATTPPVQTVTVMLSDNATISTVIDLLSNRFLSSSLFISDAGDHKLTKLTAHFNGNNKPLPDSVITRIRNLKSVVSCNQTGN